MLKEKRVTPLYKVLNGKRVPVCDYKGMCKNKAYKEIYLSLMKEKYRNKSWSYLCKKHFEQEKKKFKGKLSYCDID